MKNRKNPKSVPKLVPVHLYATAIAAMVVDQGMFTMTRIGLCENWYLITILDLKESRLAGQWCYYDREGEEFWTGCTVDGDRLLYDPGMSDFRVADLNDPACDENVPELMVSLGKPEPLPVHVAKSRLGKST